jgi:hypothetical protein
VGKPGINRKIVDVGIFDSTNNVAKPGINRKIVDVGIFDNRNNVGKPGINRKIVDVGIFDNTNNVGKPGINRKIVDAGIFDNTNSGRQAWNQPKDCPFPSVVSYFAEQASIPRLVYYFYLLQMKASDIGRVLPFVRGKRIDTVMAKVEFLRTIGVKPSSLPTVLASWPQLFMYECDQLALVEEFLKGLGFTHKELGKFVRMHPQVLGQDIAKELRPNVTFLEDLQVPLEHMKKLIIRHPGLILDGAEKSLKDLITCLESIGVRRNHIGPLLARRPALISSDVKKDVLPVGDYLKSIHATADDIDKIITSFPRLFQYDLDQVALSTCPSSPFFISLLTINLVPFSDVHTFSCLSRYRFKISVGNGLKHRNL